MQYKLHKRKALALSSLFLALNVQANECAAIKIMASSIEGEAVVHELAGHNGSLAETHNKPSQFRAVISGDKEYYLAPGKHTLTFNQWDKRKYRLEKRKLQGEMYTTRVNPPPPEVANMASSIQMNVEQNKRYNIAVKSSGAGSQTTFSIESIEDISSESCNKENVTYIASDTATELKLSKNLDYKLKQLMAKLPATQGNNLALLELNWSFGAVFDANKNSFKTLAVLPYSFASKLKLASGDEIVEINGVNVKNITSDPYGVLYGLLAEVNIGQKVNVKVIRGGSTLTLGQEYLPTIIPNVTFKKAAFDTAQSLTNAMVIPENIKYQYNNLMIEIVEYAKQSNIDLDTISIKSAAEYDVAFGIAGKDSSVSNQSVFVVTGVAANSPADKLHLMQGDKITAINEEAFTGTASKALTNMIGGLAKNKAYTLSIVRNGNKQVLSGQYTPILFPQFEMTIDLGERKLALKSLVELASNPVKYNNKQSLDFKARYIDGGPGRDAFNRTRSN